MSAGCRTASRRYAPGERECTSLTDTNGDHLPLIVAKPARLPDCVPIPKLAHSLAPAGEIVPPTPERDFAFMQIAMMHLMFQRLG